MKKILICFMLLALCTLGGCQSKPNPGGTETDALTTTAPVSQSTPAGTDPGDTHPETKPADGVLNCQRSGDTLTVTITLTECAGQEVSILALTDRQYQYTWSENPDATHDIGQITLDSQGRGSLTLKPKSADDPVCVILTASSGSYIVEVK